MTTASSLLPEAPPVAGNIFAGRVSRADPVEVTLNAYGSTHKWEPVIWMTPDTPPERGDHCRVDIDDEGTMYAWGIPA
jgi:hypothetical protein